MTNGAENICPTHCSTEILMSLHWSCWISFVYTWISCVYIWISCLYMNFLFTFEFPVYIWISGVYCIDRKIMILLHQSNLMYWKFIIFMLKILLWFCVKTSVNFKLLFTEAPVYIHDNWQITSRIIFESTNQGSGYFVLTNEEGFRVF